MKKIALFLLAASIGTATLTSCGKSKTCTCTIDGRKDSHTFDSREEAEEMCDGLDEIAKAANSANKCEL